MPILKAANSYATKIEEVGAMVVHDCQRIFGESLYICMIMNNLRSLT